MQAALALGVRALAARIADAPADAVPVLAARMGELAAELGARRTAREAPPPSAGESS